MSKGKKTHGVKGLTRNPFVYLTVALVFVVAFEAVSLVRAQYASPTAPPPGGTPATPLDTSAVDQGKNANLSVGDSSNGIGLTPSGMIVFGGLNSTGNGYSVNPGVAGIRFNQATGAMQYTTSSPAVNQWTDFGSGNGSGSLSLPLLFPSVGSGNQGIVLQSDEWQGQGWTNTPFVTWKSTMTNSPSFSIRSFVKNDGTGSLNFGVGDNSGFTPLLSMDNQGNLAISSAPITSNGTIYYAAGAIRNIIKIPANFNPATASQSSIQKYWGAIDSTVPNQRMSCDNTITEVDCSSPNGIFVETNTNYSKKYDLWINVLKSNGYTGSCPLPPNGVADGTKCQYYAADQEFNKTVANGGVIYYYQMTQGGIGGPVDNTTNPTQSQVPSGPSLDCDISPTSIDCGSIYTTNVTAASPQKAYDYYTEMDNVCLNYAGYGICNQWGLEQYNYANEYTLTSVVNNQGGGVLSVGSMKLFDNQAFDAGTLACTDANRGTVRFQQGSTADHLCYCGLSSGSYQWKCF